MSVRERIVLEESFVLHRRPYRESSLLVDIFSRQRGVLRVLAKGARRSKGGRTALLQPFVPLNISWAGNAELPILSGAESLSGACRLGGTALYCGFYLNELLLRLLPAHDPHPELFQFYGESLRHLESAERLDETLRFFELSLLEEIGYGLALDQDVVTGVAIEADKHYVYRVDEGARESAPGPDTLRGSTLLGLRQRQLAGASELREAKRLMRMVLGHYLGNRPLKSRELFKYVKSSENR
ncbi:MAG: repair protein RecO [Proteobacteria bacterium]|nr:repair protein RecO [Pseudomonadota bacterium]